MVCIASGPSLVAEDVEACRGRARVITVNSSWQLAPWADVHYSSDPPWWAHHLAHGMRAACSGEFWTGDPVYRPPGMRGVRYSKPMRGISHQPGVIAWGGNSGYCALGLAVQFGAARILLLGYDMQGDTHWHGDHPGEIRRAFAFGMWRQRFDEAARDLRRSGIPVTNCTRETALRCFRRATIQEALC